MYKIVRREYNEHGRVWLEAVVRDSENNERVFESWQDARRFADYLDVASPIGIEYDIQRA